MPRPFLLLAATLCALFGLAMVGCSHLDLSAPADGDRVVTGVISTGGEESLPDNSEVWVRVLDFSRGESRPEVLGEQTIKNPGHLPVEFKIEFRAEDAALRQYVSIDARVSVGRQLRYYTASRQPLSPGMLGEPVTVRVVPASQL